MSTVSIAMCTYNGADFLKQQLQSLARQTRKPDEIVICDDASNDQSFLIAQAFANQSGLNVRIYLNERNLGYVKNFEKAISLCTQDIVFLCDQDDLWQEEKIQKIVNAFDAEPNVGMILHNFRLIDESNQPYPGPVDTYGPSQISPAELAQEFIDHSIRVLMEPYPRAWCGCMMAYRRHFNDIVMPIFPGKGHDDWILKLLAPVTDTRFITQPLVAYRMHQKNTNRRDLEKRNLKYLIGRFIHKAKLVIQGHTKRGFYREIINRLAESGYAVKHPQLLKHYRRYSSGR